MAYAVVRTDRMTGTDNRAYLVSLLYKEEETPAAIENGNVALLGGLEDGEREIFGASTPAADSDLKDIVLVASPELMYCPVKKNLDEFRNEAGDIARGYYLHNEDIFSVTKDALDGVTEPEVGNVVELKAGTKLNVAASATSGSTQVGKIIAIETVGRYTYYVIQVKA